MTLFEEFPTLTDQEVSELLQYRADEWLFGKDTFLICSECGQTLPDHLEDCEMKKEFEI